MAYEYDIFVSYMHDEQMGDWVPKHLVPFVESFVGNALAKPIAVFIDRNGIRGGESWPKRLQQALACSKCMIAVWAPLYFHSEWCRRECAAMLYREQQLGLRSAQDPRGLIVPVNVFDGEYFPRVAKDIEWLDCQDYWIAGDGFSKTEKYVAFQDALKKWAPDVAGVLRRPPRWRKAWKTDPWLDLPDEALLPESTKNFEYIGLE